MKSKIIILGIILIVVLSALIISCGGESSDQIIGEEHAQLTQAPYVPHAITRKHPTKVIIDLEVREVIKQLSDGVEYVFWTFGGDVPGSFIRVREGDLIEFHLHNHPLNKLPHNIDLHAVTGPGGGATSSFTAPGHTSIFSFTVKNPGLFVYHCATAPVGMHIANGMYGLILVEQKEGLPPVDREYYVMQSEFYTEGNYGDAGLQSFSMQKALTETPDYVVFNGSVGSMVGDKSLKANVGERVRLYIGNGGPNLVSSFHVIGEIFDLVYSEGGNIAVQKNVQTTLIPSGGSSIVEFKVNVPGNFIMVDHSIFRAFNKGALGMLTVSGAEDKTIYSGKQKDELYSGSISTTGGVNPFTGELNKENGKEGYVSKYSTGDSKVDENLLKTAMAEGSKASSPTEMLNMGQSVYNQSCVACHQADGKGIANVFPPLANSDWLKTHSKEEAIKNVIAGRTGELTVNNKTYNGIMPPQNLSDLQSAAVLTYVYKKFAGKDVSVSAEDVKKVRAGKK
ncbi:MAG: copper-containing nitrite reductase [Melioribacteraceae bacterium]